VVKKKQPQCRLLQPIRVSVRAATQLRLDGRVSETHLQPEHVRLLCRTEERHRGATRRAPWGVAGESMLADRG